jgi:hypothetical protein
MSIFLTGRRSPTTTLAQMHAYDLNLCTDLHCSRRTLTLAAPCSSAATSPTNALMGVGCRQPVRLPRANPHSARGTTACHFPRFRSLKAFGRRPRCTPRRRDRQHPKPSTLSARRGKLQGQPCPQCPVSDGRPEKGGLSLRATSRHDRYTKALAKRLQSHEKPREIFCREPFRSSRIKRHVDVGPCVTSGHASF